MNKYMKTGKEVLKTITGIGNGVLTGLVAGLSVTPYGIPLKVCACVSSLVLGGIMTDKTDEYIDKTAEEIEKQIKEAAAKISEEDEEIKAEAFEK